MASHKNVRRSAPIGWTGVSTAPTCATPAGSQYVCPIGGWRCLQRVRGVVGTGHPEVVARQRRLLLIFVSMIDPNSRVIHFPAFDAVSYVAHRAELTSILFVLDELYKLHWRITQMEVWQRRAHCCLRAKNISAGIFCSENTSADIWLFRYPLSIYSCMCPHLK